MQRDATIGNLLGLTQNDIALMLNISRSQWSMFELGKRDLPPAATIKLAEMLQLAQQAPTNARKPVPEIQQETIRKELEFLMGKNEYQQRLVTAKISALGKKQANKIKALHLVEQLAKKADQEQVPVLRMIRHKASKASDDKMQLALFSYQLKLELLRAEKIILETEMQKNL